MVADNRVMERHGRRVTEVKVSSNRVKAYLVAVVRGRRSVDRESSSLRVMAGMSGLLNANLVGGW